MGFSAAGPGYRASCSSWGLAATLSLAITSQLSQGVVAPACLESLLSISKDLVSETGSAAPPILCGLCPCWGDADVEGEVPSWQDGHSCTGALWKASAYLSSRGEKTENITQFQLSSWREDLPLLSTFVKSKGQCWSWSLPSF